MNDTGDRTRPRAADFTLSADYIVLGGGSAGCVLADRLSEGGRHQVLLVEAGGGDRHPYVYLPAGFMKLLDHPQRDWRYRGEPDVAADGRRVAYPQGRMLGGTGSLNGMLYVRSSRTEHERWVAQGCSGWSYDEVLSIYERIENVDGAAPDHPLPVSSPLEVHPLTQAFLAACGEAGLPVRESLNGREREGAATFHQNRAGRFRGGPAQSYLRRARSRANLRVLTGTLARRILFDGRRAVGVELFGSAGALTVRARREVVVACGTIRSPQLLQLSGIGAAPLLATLGVPLVVARPAVGTNLHDHFSARISQRVAGIGTLNERGRSWRLGSELFAYLVRGNGLLTSGASSAAVFARSDPALPGPDLQLSFAPGSFEPGTYRLERQGGMTIAVLPSFPSSTGSVLAKSVDIAEPPAITPNYLATAGDQAALIAGLRLARRLFAMPSLARWLVAETLPGARITSDAQLLDYARHKGVSGYHLVGTCRMGGDDDAVVDPQLRVRGVTGLRVVDASILPSGTSGNSNAPTIMVAEKGAAMMLADGAGG